MTPKALRVVRLELGISIPDLAERIGVPANTVDDWEQGEAPLDVAAVRALLNAPAAIRHLLLVETQGKA